MIAYFITSDENPTEISWNNTTCLVKNLEKALETKANYEKQFAFVGYVLKVDMDEDDVIQAVLSCMHGNSYKVKISVLETH